jgi:hypothetical protein
MSIFMNRVLDATSTYAILFLGLALAGAFAVIGA